jgi:putative transposase
MDGAKISAFYEKQIRASHNLYYQYKESLRDILKQLCNYKGVEIIEGHIMPDHVHMLLSIPPKMSVSSFMGYLKGSASCESR